MIELETIGVAPDGAILTIDAQRFIPHGDGWHDRHYKARVSLDEQSARVIGDGTVYWWSQQSAEAQEEAFGEAGRIPLQQALGELFSLMFHADHIWANGITFDIVILEHAFKSYEMGLPFKYYKVLDARTVYNLWPDLPRGAVSHHALDDCQQQILKLQATLKHLEVNKLK
jgi:hypothetical protein